MTRFVATGLATLAFLAGVKPLYASSVCPGETMAFLTAVAGRFQVKSWREEASHRVRPWEPRYRRITREFTLDGRSIATALGRGLHYPSYEGPTSNQGSNIDYFERDGHGWLRSWKEGVATNTPLASPITDAELAESSGLLVDAKSVVVLTSSAHFLTWHLYEPSGRLVRKEPLWWKGPHMDSPVGEVLSPREGVYQVVWFRFDHQGPGMNSAWGSIMLTTWEPSSGRMVSRAIETVRNVQRVDAISWAALDGMMALTIEEVRKTDPRNEYRTCNVRTVFRRLPPIPH